MIFSNKHVIVAFIVAPILAIITYYGVDYMVSEKPSAAVQGASYKLASRPNCLHASGMCGFVNGDVEFDIVWEGGSSGYGEVVAISKKLPISGIKMAFGDPELSMPMDFQMRDNNPMEWRLPLNYHPAADEAMHVVVSINESLYFGEATAVFFDYQTSYHQDFREEAIR
jgi:hypothetical protein